MISHLLAAISAKVVAFSTFIVLLTWLSALFGAAITFLRRKGDGHPCTLRGFVQFCLPPAIWTHPSPRLDLLYYVAQHAMTPLMKAPIVLSSGVVAVAAHDALTYVFGAREQTNHSFVVWLAMLAVALVAADFGTFITHYLAHKLAPLWEIHKVHHSVEFLIPLSNRRIHPLEEIYDVSGVAFLSGTSLGVLSYVLSAPVYDSTIAGLDVFFIANLLSFYHLRHSFIDMSYGPCLEKWILSPAQHQLHHSQEVRHWDKNFGLFLACWDRLFGTLLPAERYGTYRLGLPQRQGEELRSVLGLYVTPLRNIARMALTGRRGRSAARPAAAPADAVVE